ncbi:hypothetical protein BDD12DRAFT_503926 [Trichophaea hybrida]|nr:hypothetical protein BDD12DRAFT_503926 [Trichophaea hybrida]
MAVDPDPSDIVTLNIISSHKISSKTSHCISLLYNADAPIHVVGLHAKSSVAAKAITIAEIVKRHICEQGDKWYQYTQLSHFFEEPISSKRMRSRKRRREYPRAKQDDNWPPLESGEEKDGNDEESDPFEKLEDDDLKNTRATPVLTIYISRTRLLTFAKFYWYIPQPRSS